MFILNTQYGVTWDTTKECRHRRRIANMRSSHTSHNQNKNVITIVVPTRTVTCIRCCRNSNMHLFAAAGADLMVALSYTTVAKWWMAWLNSWTLRLCAHSQCPFVCLAWKIAHGWECIVVTVECAHRPRFWWPTESIHNNKFVILTQEFHLFY